MFAIGCTMGLQATAKGVEAKEYLNWLLRRGFQTGQGYLFSRPVPIAEAVHFVLANLGRRRSFYLEPGGDLASSLNFPSSMLEPPTLAVDALTPLLSRRRPAWRQEPAWVRTPGPVCPPHRR